MERTPSTAAAAAARKQMILPSKSNGSNRALNGVGVQFGAAVGQEASQSMPARQRVGDELEWDGRARAMPSFHPAATRDHAAEASPGRRQPGRRAQASRASSGAARCHHDPSRARAGKITAERGRQRSFTAMPRAASKSRSPVRKKRRRAALPWGRTHGPEGGRKARRREPRARRC